MEDSHRIALIFSVHFTDTKMFLPLKKKTLRTLIIVDRILQTGHCIVYYMNFIVLAAIYLEHNSYYSSHYMLDNTVNLNSMLNACKITIVF